MSCSDWNFLFDLHIKKDTDPFFEKLDKSGDAIRHKWINKRINEIFEERGIQ